MLSPINLMHLKYFFDAALLGSVSAAARENYVSQSAISQGISRLEQALQVTLSTHQRQGFQLTEEGQIVLEEAKTIFTSVEWLQEKLNALKGEVSGEVKFACTNSLAQFYIPYAYLQMQKHYPKVKITFHRGSLQFIHEALRNKKVSFAIVLDAKSFSEYDCEIIGQGNYQIYQAKGLKKSPGVFVDHMENVEVVELRRQYKERYGKELKIADAISSWTLVHTFVQKGCGQGYLPDFMIQHKKEIVKVKLELPPIHYTICVIKPRGSVLTRAQMALVETLKTTQF